VDSDRSRIVIVVFVVVVAVMPIVSTNIPVTVVFKDGLI
jgi:hypothetical protein